MRETDRKRKNESKGRGEREKTGHREDKIERVRQRRNERRNEGDI